MIQVGRARSLTLTLVVLGVSSLVLQSGCASRGKKAPPAAPELAVETHEATPVPRPVSVSPSGDPVAPDPWSGDLGELNAYIARNGLLGTVYFDFDRAELRPEARTQLDKNARFLREHPELQIQIEGHCDDRGTAEYNIALGEQRASATLRYLATLGVGGGRLQAVSYGKERPQCTENAEGCWSQNRRAAFVVTGRANSGST